MFLSVIKLIRRKISLFSKIVVAIAGSIVESNAKIVSASHSQRVRVHYQKNTCLQIVARNYCRAVFRTFICNAKLKLLSFLYLELQHAGHRSKLHAMLWFVLEM